MLSGAAFNAFLKTLEEPPAHVVFILATTDPQEDPGHRALALPALRLPPDPARAADREPHRHPRRRRACPSSRARCRSSCARPRAACATRSRCSTPRSPTARASSTRRAWRGCSARPRPVHVRGFVGALLARDGAAALEAIDRAATRGRGPGHGSAARSVEMTRRLLVIEGRPGRALRRSDARRGGRADGGRGAGVSADELVYVLRAFLDADAEMRRSPHPRVELEIAAVRATRRPAAAGHRGADRASSRRRRRGCARCRRPRAARRAAPWSCRRRLLDARPAPATPPRPARRRSPRCRRLRAPAPVLSGSSSRSAEAEPLIEAAAADMVATEPALPAPAGLEDAWERVVTEVMKRKALLGSVLQHATPLRRARTACSRWRSWPAASTGRC